MTIYEIITRSSIKLNDISLYDETVIQRWGVAIEDVSEVGCLLIIDMVQKPKTNSVEMQPLYTLLDITNDVIIKIVLRIDRFRQIIGVANQKEIIKAWQECKKRIFTLLGREKFVAKILDDADFNFGNVCEAVVQCSVPYFIIIYSLTNDRHFRFHPKSVINSKEEINVKTKHWDKKCKENGYVRFIEGEGRLGFFSKACEKYNMEIKPYAKADFDFRYRLNAECLYTSGCTFFDKAIATVTEQASLGYIYESKIEIIQLK